VTPLLFQLQLLNLLKRGHLKDGRPQGRRLLMIAMAGPLQGHSGNEHLGLLLEMHLHSHGAGAAHCLVVIQVSDLQKALANC
jgi:hypothetical protein